MKLLDRNIWRSRIATATKIQLYTVYVLPVLLYGAETWTMTKAMNSRLDAFDQWCQRRILRIHYSLHITNEEVRRRTGCPILSETLRSRRLRLFGHFARCDPCMDHGRALRAIIAGLPADWRRPRGRLRHTWTRTMLA